MVEQGGKVCGQGPAQSDEDLSFTVVREGEMCFLIADEPGAMAGWCVLGGAMAGWGAVRAAGHSRCHGLMSFSSFGRIVDLYNQALVRSDMIL